MKAEIWNYGKGFIKVFVLDYEQKKQVAKWEGARVHCHYFLRDGSRGWDIILSRKLYNNVAKFLGLPERNKKIGSQKKRGDFTQGIFHQSPVATRILSKRAKVRF